jgi:succinate dehydrogenase / fumarate reductase cytochrome b subunit
MSNEPSPRKFLRWFDPRFRQIGTWAFILNRVTALGLTAYLALHLFMLGNLAIGEEAYNNFIALAKTPPILVGELLVVAAVLIHGLNGIRIALNSFGVGVRYQKQTFIALMLVSIAFTIYFGIHMFSAA